MLSDHGHLLVFVLRSEPFAPCGLLLFRAQPRFWTHPRAEDRHGRLGWKASRAAPSDSAPQLRRWQGLYFSVPGHIYNKVRCLRYEPRRHTGQAVLCHDCEWRCVPPDYYSAWGSSSHEQPTLIAGRLRAETLPPTLGAGIVKSITNKHSIWELQLNPPTQNSFWYAQSEAYACGWILQDTCKLHHMDDKV